ncbi:MAG TPA: glycosyltransferase [Chthoniobacterales bacterium]|nr:glycosyltransferase [Chthoniobacterales bacterium]
MHGNGGILVWTICYFTVLAGMSFYGLHRYFILLLYFRNRHRRPLPPQKFSNLPTVTVQLPIYNEIYVIERLLAAVSQIEYPREKLEIQILDDSTDETRDLADREAMRLRRSGFQVEILRRVNRIGFKAGALNNGLRKAKGEFFLILDADFIPHPNILQETVHYFTDPAIGMIQTRWGHINRSYSWLTRAQAILLDGHLLLEQTARSRTGRFFNFNGTAGLWRRSCIEQAGGWQYDTLTEDLDLSYRAQINGAKFLFLSDLVTPAELPVDMSGFKSQQHRWTKGSIQTCKKVLPLILKSHLPWWIKIEALVHLTSNFAYLLLALLCILLHPSAMCATVQWQQALIDLPIFAATTLSVAVFYLCAQRELYPKDWKREVFFFPFVLALGIGISINNARAVLEAVFNHDSPFARTPKYGFTFADRSRRKNRYASFSGVFPLIELFFAIYFTYFVITALESREILSLPFLILFQLGFAYVALTSLRERAARSHLGAREVL